MSENFHDLNRRTAEFYWQNFMFFRDISLLAKEIVRSIESLGWQVVVEHQGDRVPFQVRKAMADGIDFPQIINSRYYAPDEKRSGLNHNSFGIFFGNTDPKSPVLPWIPEVLFLKAVLKSESEWNLWHWNISIMQEFNRLSGDREWSSFESAQHPVVMNIDGDSVIDQRLKGMIDTVTVQCFPLAAFQNSEEVQKIVQVALLGHQQEKVRLVS